MGFLVAVRVFVVFGLLVVFWTPNLVFVMLYLEFRMMCLVFVRVDGVMIIKTIMINKPRFDDQIIMTSNRGAWMAWIWMKSEQKKDQSTDDKGLLWI